MMMTMRVDGDHDADVKDVVMDLVMVIVSDMMMILMGPGNIICFSSLSWS